MTVQYLLDTCIVIDLLRRPERLDRQRFVAADDRVAVSSVTVMELEYGTERSADPSRSRSEVTALLARVQILPFDQAAAEHAGRVRAALAARGQPIGPFDSLLAGHARSAGLTLVTHSTSEFARVPGLMTEDWTS
ncbi:MAG: type II toxin-antitoxin system VapC family toxin [Cellulomonas sp.]|nr:type II toxin-antitoxin system VapC family toxin [Cellulomonas sp.]